jgi:uncharacterized protein YndB with AHSA1/START domain
MDKPVVEVDTMIAADPKAVWAAMTARQSAMFPRTTVETDWKIGHLITFSGEWEGKSFMDRGEIQSVEEDRELSFTHWSELSGQSDRPENYHVVRYRLEPQGDRTRVSLAQFNRGSKTDIDAETRAEYEKNWRMILDSLKNAVENH